MAVVKLNKKELKKLIGNIENSEIDGYLGTFGIGVEKIDGDEIEVEITPNRPDMLSSYGIIRALESYTGKKLGLKEIKIKKPEKNYEIVIDKSVLNIRPYTACAIVKNLNFNDEKIKEIIDMQEKLHNTLGRNRKKAAIGIYPMEKIILPIYYKALYPEDIKFQPLEFHKELNAKQILIQHPKGREYRHLLEDYEKYPIFIDSSGEVLSMPPIINSHKTGKISLDTKDIFVECSGNEIEILIKILNIIIYTLSEMGGEIYQMKIKSKSTFVTPDLTPEKIKFSFENANKLLGINISEKEAKRLLEKMGHQYIKGFAIIPPYRADIMHENDLIEDIAIAYGYDKFIPTIPEISTIGKTDRREDLKKRFSEILSGLSMLETLNYHLVTKEIIKKSCGNIKDFIRVKNSRTEYEYLRKDISTNLLNIFYENSDSEYPQEIFQIGKVFNHLNEEEHLAIAISPGNFTKMKQIFNYLANSFKIEFSLNETRNFPEIFIDGRIAEVFLDGKSIGFFGEVHPKILKNFNLKMSVALLEISIEEILTKLS
ncbi:MAG: phenylalanine--tRNA ligase subunit beta [Candidatus Pacearchaeota archaeon]